MMTVNPGSTVDGYTADTSPLGAYWFYAFWSAGGTLALKNRSIQLENLCKAPQAEYAFKAATELTIASGAITVTQSSHKLQPQSGTADDLDTVNGLKANTFYVFHASDFGTDTITFKHGVDNISCPGGTDVDLDEGFLVGYSPDGSNLLVAGGGGGGGGGGITLDEVYAMNA